MLVLVWITAIIVAIAELLQDDSSPLVMAVCTGLIVLPWALSNGSGSMLTAEPEDPVVEQIYHRYKVYDPARPTNWVGLEDELMRYVFNGDPVLHVDSEREYPMSVDECQAHRYPMDPTNVLSVVYQREPHAACPYCGLILTKPYVR